MTLLYFAYGANMNHKHMKDACSQSKFVKRVFLEGHKIIYDGYSDYMRRRARANVISSEGDVVWGGLYEINETDLAGLDVSEFAPNSFDRKTTVVKDEDGKTYDVIVYCREKRELCAPSTEYRQTIIQGAKDCKLPQEYIRGITYRVSG